MSSGADEFAVCCDGCRAAAGVGMRRVYVFSDETTEAAPERHPYRTPSHIVRHQQHDLEVDGSHRSDRDIPARLAKRRPVIGPSRLDGPAPSASAIEPPFKEQPWLNPAAVHPDPTPYERSLRRRI
jgi:hypothetical protein